MSAVSTVRGPVLVRHRALEILASHLGEQEVGGENRGPVVRWACRGRDGVRWCAYAICQSFREALNEYARPDWTTTWDGIASGSCDTLWQRMFSQGWAVPDGGSPAPGDVIFTGKPEDLNHVMFVLSVEAGVLVCIGGNTGDGVNVRASKLSDKKWTFLARCPW